MLRIFELISVVDLNYAHLDHTRLICEDDSGNFDLPHSANPTVYAELNDIFFLSGQRLQLACEVTGIPDPVVTWTLNGNLIDGSTDGRVSFDRDVLVSCLMFKFNGNSRNSASSNNSRGSKNNGISDKKNNPAAILVNYPPTLLNTCQPKV